MNCKIPHCKNPATISAIIDGTYYDQICQIHKGLLSTRQKISSGHARWSRDMDGQDHEADIAQPYDRYGKPNPTFIRLYPEQSKALFDEETMRKYS